jgi:Cd2+/Zn2+-exporting ATPase
MFNRLSHNTRRILVQNICFSITLKVLFLTITIAGYGDMWMAVFADVGASLIVVANGLRLLKIQF